MTTAGDQGAEAEAVITTDFTVEADELRRFEYKFKLMPELWDRYNGPDNLKWTCVIFRKDQLPSVPDTPGVYAFCVQPSIGGNLCGSYLLYIGKTDRGLRTRCREYLGEAQTASGRYKLQRMLRLFAGTAYLRFCFAVVREADPASIESSLLEATVPPACTALPASVRPAVDAF